MAYGEAPLTLPDPISTTGNSGALTGGIIIGLGDSHNLRAQLSVGTVTGTTPNLVVLLEDSLDGTNWNTIGTFAAKNASSQREVLNVTTPFADRVRASWTVTGTTPVFNTPRLILSWD